MIVKLTKFFSKINPCFNGIFSPLLKAGCKTVTGHFKICAARQLKKASEGNLAFNLNYLEQSLYCFCNFVAECNHILNYLSAAFRWIWMKWDWPDYSGLTGTYIL